MIVKLRVSNLRQPSFQALHQEPQQSPAPARVSGSRSGAVARLDTIYSAIKAANEKYEHENSDNTAALVYTELPSLGLARCGGYKYLDTLLFRAL